MIGLSKLVFKSRLIFTFFFFLFTQTLNLRQCLRQCFRINSKN